MTSENIGERVRVMSRREEMEMQIRERGQCTALTFAGKRCQRPVAEYPKAVETQTCFQHMMQPDVVQVPGLSDRGIEQ